MRRVEMDRMPEAQLLAYLRDELGERERRLFAQRMASDADLRSEFGRLSEVWAGLENPAPPAAPDGFVAAVRERIELESSPAWSPGLRWAATGIACSGIVLGAVVGIWAAPAEDEAAYSQPSLAESYLALLEEEGS